MNQQAKRIALCGMMTALGVVVMLLGAWIELGMYAAPMVVGLCLSPIGHRYGGKYQLTVWAAISALCAILVANVEQNLLFFGFFGWYPVLFPRLATLLKPIRLAVKLALFNGIILLLETLILLVLVPEAITGWMVALLLLLANVTFLLYDRLIPVFTALAVKYLRRFF